MDGLDYGRELARDARRKEGAFYKSHRKEIEDFNVKAIHKRIKKMRRVNIEDVAFAAYAKALKDLRGWDNGQESRDWKYKGTLNYGASKFSFFEEEGKAHIIIAGGAHKMYVNLDDKREKSKFVKRCAELLGLKVYAQKNRGWVIYIGKR